MNRAKKLKWLEWCGAASAVVYAQLIAYNIGAEVAGFLLLFLSAALLGIWAHLGKHRGLFILQLFYAATALIGIARWL